eukprot:COSAG03_NODE_24347_length_273_cov_0.580460_1_plen_79_part_10
MHARAAMADIDKLVVYHAAVPPQLEASAGLDLQGCLMLEANTAARLHVNFEANTNGNPDAATTEQITSGLLDASSGEMV